jgi:uncharacterized protein YbaR (Trm112 family)
MTDSGSGQSGPTAAESSRAEADGRPHPRMLETLVCPCTRTTLVYDAAHQELISRAARLAFPIRDGVPVMKPDEARVLDEEELRRLGKS